MKILGFEIKRRVEEAVIAPETRRAVAHAANIQPYDDRSHRDRDQLFSRTRELTPTESLNVVKQSRYMYDIHGTAEQIINRMKTFILKGGVEYKLTFDDTLPEELRVVIERRVRDVWERNKVKQRCEGVIVDQHLAGEHVWEFEVDDSSGFVWINDVLREQIKRVYKTPRDQGALEAIEICDITPEFGMSYTTRELKALATDEEPYSPAFGHLVGNCLMFMNATRASSSRGKPELQSILSELVEERKFRFLAKDRMLDLMGLFYQVIYEGMTDEEIQTFVQANEANMLPIHGSVKHTNEKVKYNMIQSDMKAMDQKVLLLNDLGFIVGSKGMPQSWFGFGGETNYATAQTQQFPIFADLANKEAAFLQRIETFVRFVVDQAIVKNYIAPLHGAWYFVGGDPLQPRLIRDAVNIQVYTSPLPRIADKEPLTAIGSYMDILIKEATVAEAGGASNLTEDLKKMMLSAALKQDEIDYEIPRDIDTTDA